MIEVAFTYYPPGEERTQWLTLPAVPRVGETVYLPNEPDHNPFRVTSVSWADDHPGHPGWHAEISLS